MNFDTLPDVLFSNIYPGDIEADMIRDYEQRTNSVLYPGDPVRLLITTLAYAIGQYAVNTDWTAKQNLLRYATGNFLEHKGAFHDVYRRDATPAKTSLKFTLSAIRQVNTVIPIGTRATADGRIFFATDNILVIEAGSLTGEVEATCLTYGIEGNNFIVGQIKVLVDTSGDRGFVSRVENTLPTTGGADIEDDESLRNRIRLAPESLSTAGPDLAYIFWALSAHNNIGDVAVFSPSPGIVNVFVMLKGGFIPDEDGAEIKAVIEALSDKKRRPLTDFVAVLPVNHEPIDYTVKWFITTEQAVLYNEISQRIAAAVKEYEDWQVARIGRDIVPDNLVKLCMAAGAKRVEINGLYFTNIDDSSVANFIDNPDRIQFGGVERE